MAEEKTNGLLLQSTPYLMGRRILKVLTAESGLISLIAYRKTSSILTTPFVWAEWVFEKSNRDIYALKDATLIDDLSSLKQEYSRLSAAGQMASDLLHTQMPGKSAAEAICLTLACFRKLPLFERPLLLAASFRLKLLFCEGLLHPDDLTSPFLQKLALSRSFQELSLIDIEESGMRQIELLIEERLDFPRQLT